MTDEERYLFDLMGYLVVPNVLTALEIQELNSIIDRLGDWEERTGSRHVHTGMDEEHVSQAFHDPRAGLVEWFSGLMLEWGDGIRQLVGHDRIFPYIKELLGNAARLDHQYAVLQRRCQKIEGTLALHGGGTPPSPHEYYRYQNGEFFNGLTVFSFALTDVPLGAGGFGCLPGSHKSNIPLPQGFKSLFPARREVVHVPMKAGDVLIFTEALTHGTLAWTSSHERRALLFKYCPAHMQWERNSPYAPIGYDWTPRQRALLRRPYVARRQQCP